MQQITAADLSPNGINGPWLYNALAPNVYYSPGLKVIFEKAEAYWLLTDILAHIKANPDFAKAEATDPDFADLNFWNLTVSNGRGVLVCEKDSGLQPVVRQEYEYTDFPLPKLTIYCRNWHDGRHALCLPTED